MKNTYYVGESGILVHNACDNVPTRELTPTHQLTKSRKEMINLVDDVRVNGIQDPIKYVNYRGGKYVVDGHHRLAAAKRLNMNCVPATEVSLPYTGYKTIDDLLW